VVYRGPFKTVEDDDGHVFPRGKRIAVSGKSFQLLQREPYVGQFNAVLPRDEAPLDAQPFDDRGSMARHPRETKGEDYKATTDPASSCCGNGDSCC
jgi:hypothetical protein